MKENIKILLLDNTEDDIVKITDLLVSYGYQPPTVVKNIESFEKLCMDGSQFDVIISEQEIEEYNSLQILNIARQKCPDIIFILVSDKISDEFGIELLKEGVDIYFLKPQFIKIPAVIEKLYAGRHIQDEIKKLSLINQKLQEAYREIEIKNENMIQSIIFAKRIQSLMFPKIDLLLKNFDEAFILYKPKDIVSGDFYWFNKCAIHERFAIAIGDCTGHGVSGALLSMIGYNLLNEIIHDDDHTSSPSEILTELDRNMVELLHQNTTHGYQDGIDMSFVSIDQEKKKLWFCGCKRPLLYLVRDEKKIIVYKGEPYLVGGIDSRVEKTFKTQEIEYKKGDVIYMLTDGFTDQFGGPKGKKLMKDRFAEMLLSIQHLNLSYQAQLLEQRYLKWKGENEQTDDILIVAVKL